MSFARAALGVATSMGLILAATAARADGPRDGMKESGSYERPFSWTGFYVGAAVGYGIGAVKDNVHNTIDGSDAVSEIFFRRDDTAIRGAQRIVSAGYDSQVSQRVVVGMLIDYAFGKVDGTFFEQPQSIDKQFALGARLGYLLAPKTLLFATAGWTRAEYENEAFEITKSRNGYFVGAGLEQALANNWSLKLEYRFSDYRAVTAVEVQLDDNVTRTFRNKLDSDVHSVRLGVNYKFGR